MNRLKLRDSKLQSTQLELPDDLVSAPTDLSSASVRIDGDRVSEDAIDQVDQFLREALQNPRERLSVLRMEQDIEKFIRDPTQQQLEFQQLPTSYLRLAAHRVAQHYSLQSMVLLDNSLPDGSGSRIIVHKGAGCRIPLIRLADIPVNLPSEDGSSVKVAIKQRPRKQSQTANNSNSNSSKSSSSKSMEERKEEYNKARARIFNSTNHSGNSTGKAESEPRSQDIPRLVSAGLENGQVKTASGNSAINRGRGVSEPSTSTPRFSRPRMENEPINRPRPNSKVAIFRDREIDRKDPDYDRSYDRYTQRYDTGFGFSGGPYTIQPMYAPALSYNTEFPQLGACHRPQMPTEHQPRPLPQHLVGTWVAPSAPAGLGYGHPETMMQPYSPHHMGMRPNSGLYLHSSQYPCQRPGMSFINPHDHIQPFAQSQQPQSDASFGLARPR
ncbi:R3H domain-containing protein 2 [Linum grandiflorum]